MSTNESEPVIDKIDSETGLTPLQLAIKTCNLRKIQNLISKGANVNLRDSDGWTPLHFATNRYTHTGHHKMMELLLKNGANVNACDAWGKRPLHYLVEHSVNTVETVRLFLDFKADVDVEDHAGETPLFRALYWGATLDVVKLLLDNGASFDLEKYQNWALLNKSEPSKFLNFDTIQFLVKEGADINQLVIHEMRK